MQPKLMLGSLKEALNRPTLEDGDKGLHATSVQIVDEPGTRAGKAATQLIEPPLGWQ